MRFISRTVRRRDDELAAGEAFAEPVVGIAFQANRKSCRNERTERLAASAAGTNGDGILGQGGSELFRDLTSQDRPERAVRAGDLCRDLRLLRPVSLRIFLQEGQQDLLILCFLKVEVVNVLFPEMISRALDIFLIQDAREIRK